MLSWNDQSVLRYDCQDLVGNSTSGVVTLNVQQSNSITVPMREQIYDCTYDEQLPQAPLGYMWLKSQISTYTENNNRNVTVVNRLISVGASATTITPTTPPPTPTNTVAPTPTPTVVKRVFVTSQSYNGNLGGTTGADSKCQLRATTANLGGTWRAWVSSTTSDVNTRFTHHNGTYALLDGRVVAQSWADLTDQSIGSAIDMDENRLISSIPVSGWNVWTNTSSTGTVYDTQPRLTCNNWTSSTGINYTGRGGSMRETTYRWTASELAGHACNQMHRLYCVEQ